MTRPVAPRVARRARRGGTIRGGYALVLAIAAWGVLSPLARADEADDLRQALVSGARETWPSVLKRVERTPALVGAVLGPLLRDRTVGEPSAYAAAWLADRAAKDGVPLLADEVLLRARDDLSWALAVKESLAKDGGGWAALVRAARRRVADEKASATTREAATWLLRVDPTKESARLLAELWANGPETVRPVAQEGLRVLLAYPFASPDEAKAWFDAHDGETLLDWLRALSAAKDAPDWPLYARVVAEARANVLRLSSAKDLARYLSPAETPWPEVRRLAAARAAGIEAPGEEWLPVLAAALDGEPDRETLLSLLEVARRLKPAPGAASSPLVATVLARLPGCCGEPELLLRFLAVLGAVADAGAVTKAYDVLERVRSEEVAEAWVSVAGEVGENDRTLTRFLAGRSAAKDESSIRLRARALEALAHGAARSSPESAERAGAVLRAVLRPADAPDGEGAVPRETAAAPRLAAIRGLEGFPSPETAARLADLATDPDDSTAALAAIETLSRLAPRSEDATFALVAVAREPGPPEPRLKALAGLSRAALDTGPSVRAAAGPALRSLLSGAEAPLSVRTAALDAVAALGDADALPAAFAFAASRTHGGVADVPPEVTGALDRLVRAVAMAGSTHDAAIAEGLSRLVAAGGLDAAVEAADAAADAGSGRLALQVARAELHLARSRADAPPERRDADLAAARRILRSVVTPDVPREDRTTEAWRRAVAAYETVLTGLLEDADPAAKKGLLAEALRFAVAAADPVSAAKGKERAAALLALDLTQAERDEALALSKRLDGSLKPPPPR